MNRRSLFGRFALPLSGDRPANRLEKRRFHMEPLEVRQVLATMYVDDNWVSQTPGAGTLTQGDTVVSGTGGITAAYGDNAFGLVTNATSSTGNGYLTVAGQGVSTRYIDDAIGRPTMATRSASSKVSSPNRTSSSTRASRSGAWAPMAGRRASANR